MRILSFVPSRRLVGMRSVLTVVFIGLLALVVTQAGVKNQAGVGSSLAHTRAGGTPAVPMSGSLLRHTGAGGMPAVRVLAKPKAATAAPHAGPPAIALVSSNSDRTDSGNGESHETAISADGRYIAFTSMATNLVADLNDINNASDVFLYDRLNNVTQLVSKTATPNVTGNGASGISGTIDISADGRFVVYATQASDIVPFDNNGVSDVVLFDRTDGPTGVNHLVSARFSDRTFPANGASLKPVISADGRIVTFTSLASDLSPSNDFNDHADLYACNFFEHVNFAELVSVNFAGNNGGNDDSPTWSLPSISNDGRFVAFESEAGDLVPTDTNGAGSFGSDVFVRDLQSDITMLASVNSAGSDTGNFSSFDSSVAISGNGRFVVFASMASNLVAGLTDNNTGQDVFRRDLVAGTTSLVSANLAGNGVGNARSKSPSVSNDGRFIAFTSLASNLVPTDTNSSFWLDIFVRDMQTSTTELVSVKSAGTDSGNGSSFGPPVIDSTGRYVLFQSNADNLTGVGDFNSNPDFFLRDLQTDSTTLITVGNSGEASGVSSTNEYSLSSDGQVGAFDSDASDLVRDDTNNETDVFVFGEPGPELSVSDATVTEGNSGSINALFTVNLAEGPASGNVTVEAFSQPGTASFTQDFNFVSMTLTFAPGETTKTVAVPVFGDAIFEGNETFTLNLRNETGAGVVDRIGTGTIIDDEPQPTLSINDVSIIEGDSFQRDAFFTVSLSGLSSKAVGFSYGLTQGTAIDNEDYIGGGGSGIIAAGFTQTTVAVHIIGDTITEPDETLFVTLFNPSNATISDNQGVATIINDESASDPPTFQFSVTNPVVSEGVGSIVVEVTRSGNLSAPATVEYATIAAPGFASDRSDYTAAIGKLSYAAGESSKTFRIFITDDVFVEGPEAIAVGLVNPTGGASLGSPENSFIGVIDNDTSPPTSNPVDEAQFFVRQHYIDFLNREPDAAGLAFWTSQITECQQPGATCNPEVRRINVSAAFFLSIEFQQTGYLVYCTYKASYGNITDTPVPLRLVEFLSDTQQIGKDVILGAPGADQQLENNKVAFFLDFVSRTRFTTGYPTTMTPAEFVDALFSHAGVIPAATDRHAAINEFGGAGNSANTAARGRALRRVAENGTLRQQESNRAFVLMQYFGYLRRNPNDPPELNFDFGGYNFWLNKLNEFNGDFVGAEMVKAFLVAGEYRQRFGP